MLSNLLKTKIKLNSFPANLLEEMITLQYHLETVVPGSYMETQGTSKESR